MSYSDCLEGGALKSLIDFKRYGEVFEYVKSGGKMNVSDFYGLETSSSYIPESSIELCILGLNNLAFKELFKRNKDHDLDRYLRLSIFSNNACVLQHVLNCGVDLMSKGAHGQNPLHLAARKGATGCARVLLRNIDKFDINDVDDKGFTALHFSAASGNFELVKFLIECGAIVNPKNIYNATPLHWACCNQNSNEATRSIKKNVVRLLLNKIGNLNGHVVYEEFNSCNKAGLSPLDWCFLCKDYDTICYFLGIEPSMTSNEPEFLLEKIVSFNQQRISFMESKIKFFLES